MARELYEAALERLASALDQFDRGQLSPDDLVDEVFLMLRFAVLSEPEPFDDAATLLRTADVGIRPRLEASPDADGSRWDGARRRLEDTARLHDEAHARTIEWEGLAEGSVAGDAPAEAADDVAEVLALAEPWVGSIRRHVRAGARVHGPRLLRDVAVRLVATPLRSGDASRRWLPWVLDELAAHAWSDAPDGRGTAARQDLLELVSVPGASRQARLRLPLHLLTRPERQWLAALPADGLVDLPAGWLPAAVPEPSRRPELACLELLEAARPAAELPTGPGAATGTRQEADTIASIADAYAAYDVRRLTRLALEAAAGAAVPAWVLAVVDELAAWAAGTDPALTARPRPSADSTAEAARRALLVLAGVDALAAMALPRVPLWRLDTRDRWALEALLELREEMFREAWVDDEDIAVTEATRLVYLRGLAAKLGERA